MKKYLLIFLLAFTISCQTDEKKSETVQHKAPAHHIEAITNVFDAHGGYEQWNALKTMTYDYAGNKTTVDLQDRYTLIEGEDQQVGFDG